MNQPVQCRTVAIRDTEGSGKWSVALQSGTEIPLAGGSWVPSRWCDFIGPGYGLTGCPGVVGGGVVGGGVVPVPGGGDETGACSDPVYVTVTVPPPAWPDKRLNSHGPLFGLLVFVQLVLSGAGDPHEFGPVVHLEN